MQLGRRRVAEVLEDLAVLALPEAVANLAVEEVSVEALVLALPVVAAWVEQPNTLAHNRGAGVATLRWCQMGGGAVVIDHVP
jgi:hypothetical protein